MPKIQHDLHAVRRFLDVSTVHLDKNAQEWMDNHTGDDGGWNCNLKTAYGWFVFIIEPPTMLSPFDIMPISLDPIFEKANNLGCAYVMFDSDAPEHDDLPTYEKSGE